MKISPCLVFSPSRYTSGHQAWLNWKKRRIGREKIILKNIKATDMIYTFILYFRGGVYIEQITASNVLAATHVWAERIARSQDVEHLDGEAFLKVFYYDIEVFTPNEIEGCPNVWHLFFKMGRHKMDIHIIKTSEMPEPKPSEALSKARATA